MKSIDTNRSNTCILFINTGTPDLPETNSVKNYLKEFLMDKRVIDIPFLLRWIIVHLFILPNRPKKSAEKYKLIWEEDSPLRKYTHLLTETFSKRYKDYTAYFAMRYGNPSLASVVQKIKNHGFQKVILFPLFPHYAMSSYETATLAAEEELKKNNLQYTRIPPFYNHPAYIEALQDSIEKAHIEEYDHLIISYHSIPLRHLKKSDPTKNHCLKKSFCCDEPSIAHKTCYLYQTRETSRLLANSLSLPKDFHSVSYQSRFGRAKWISPSTEETLIQLAQKGKKKIAVIAPSFITDGLETLEEIQLTGQNIFVHSGGYQLTYINALNYSPKWIEAIHTIIEDYIKNKKSF